MFTRIDNRRKEDAQRFADLKEECQLCGAYGADKRMLKMRCFYDLKEVVPEFISLWAVPDMSDDMKEMFFLQICKSCRARLLGKLQEWRKECVDLLPYAK